MPESQEQDAAFEVFAAIAMRFPALVLLDPQIPREFVAALLEARADAIEAVVGSNPILSRVADDFWHREIDHIRAEAQALRKRKP